MGDKMKDVNILVNNGVNVEKSLELFGDMNTYDETLNLFLNEIDSKINDLKKYKEIGDMNNYSIVIHGLKSEYRYLGFESLGDLCYKHELESKANNLFFISDDFDNLINQINNSIIIAHKYFGEDTTKFEVPKKIIKDKKILVVDDEEYIRDVIVTYLNNEGYQTYQAEDGYEALDMLEKDKYDLMVLDIMMPEMDGFTLLEKLDANKKVPTIILSARGEEVDKLTGFDKGIDDYLCKPFSPKELVARCKAILNRVSTKMDNYRYKDLFINFLEHSITIDDEEINITPKEFEILEYFIRNKKVAIKRESLLKYIWGYDFYGDDRTVDTHIKMLRNHLGKYRDLIETVRGIGYRFNDEK